MATDEENQGITAYHGSPHEFDQFDLSKIGTGEGAQAYGHGLYFAEKEPIAQSYRDALSGGVALTKVDDKPVHQLHTSTDPNDRLKSEIAVALKHQSNLDKAIDFLISQRQADVTSKFLEPENKAEAAEDLKRLEEMKKNPPKVEQHKGHMYEVNINSHPNNFLDWDKPLIEQSEHIRRLAGITPEYESAYRAARKSDTDSLISALDQNTEYKRTPMPRRPEGSMHPEMSGADFYEHLTNEMGAIDWKPDADYITRQHHRQLAGENVANFLTKKGVHGIRYLDRSSRAKGEGSRNYVVFDDKLVNVKRRYARGGNVDGYDNGGGIGIGSIVAFGDPSEGPDTYGVTTPMESRGDLLLNVSPEQREYLSSEMTKQMAEKPKQTVRQNFNQAFADARARGEETFSWTNPATGRTMLYTTQLARKEGGRIPSMKNPDDWLAPIEKPRQIAKKSAVRKPAKVEGTAIVKRALMLSSRKS